MWLPVRGDKVTPDIEFSKSVFAFFALLVLHWGRLTQKAILGVFFLFLILKDFPLDVFALWFVLGAILIFVGDTLMGST